MRETNYILLEKTQNSTNLGLAEMKNFSLSLMHLRLMAKQKHYRSQD